MLNAVELAIIFGVLNRARGSKLFGFTTSTQEARLVSTVLMALVLSILGAAADHMQMSYEAFVPLWGFLMLWTVFAWDYYWGLAIGDDTDVSVKVFAPVDRIMGLMPKMAPRLYGTIAMGLRQLLLAPAIVLEAVVSGHPASAVLGLAPVFFGVPYLIGGYVSPGYRVLFAEIVVGALMGVIFAGVQS